MKENEKSKEVVRLGFLFSSLRARDDVISFSFPTLSFFHPVLVFFFFFVFCLSKVVSVNLHLNMPEELMKNGKKNEDHQIWGLSNIEESLEQQHNEEI